LLTDQIDKILWGLVKDQGKLERIPLGSSTFNEGADILGSSIEFNNTLFSHLLFDEDTTKAIEE